MVRYRGDCRLGTDIQDDALHRAYITVLQTKICGQGNDRTGLLSEFAIVERSSRRILYAS